MNQCAGMSIATNTTNTAHDCFDENPSLDGTRRRLFPETLGPASSKPDDNDETRSPDTSMEASLSKMEYHESSPTTVTDIFPAGQQRQALTMNKKRRLAPQIAMGEDGAEVSIDLSSLSIACNGQLAAETPENEKRRALEVYKQGSLMDADCTPTPPSMSKYDIGNLCCSVQHAMHDEDYSVAAVTVEAASCAEIERTISTFLDGSSGGGNNTFNSKGTGGCSGWQAWSFFLENDENTPQKELAKETIKSSLRNRACDQGAKRLRVRQLRKDLNPFTNSPKRSPAPALVKSRSFAIEDHRNGITRVSEDKRMPNNSFANVLHLCTMPENATVESPLTFRQGFEAPRKRDVCYDSDPEDFTKRRQRKRSPGDKENHKKDQLYKYSYPRLSCDSPAPGHHTEDQVVQEIFNCKSTLIYHPTSVSEKGDVHPLTPVAVDAWLERGQRLMTIIQPKWMWKPKPRARNGGVVDNETVVSIRGIELLDITRIMNIHNVNRKHYPLAKTGNSFLVKTIDNEELCFEAKSSSERDRLVYSLKVAVSRFGALVVTGNFNVYNEFFAIEGGVPGEAPDLTRHAESAEEQRELLL